MILHLAVEVVPRALHREDKHLYSAPDHLNGCAHVENQSEAVFVAFLADHVPLDVVSEGDQEAEVKNCDYGCRCGQCSFLLKREFYAVHFQLVLFSIIILST